jgi:hypothetical protein
VLEALCLLVLLVIALIVWECAHGALPSIRANGFQFLTGTDWDPVTDRYGALPYLCGTLMTSAIAMTLAVPTGIGAALYLAELASPWVGEGISFVIEAAGVGESIDLRPVGRVSVDAGIVQRSCRAHRDHALARIPHMPRTLSESARAGASNAAAWPGLSARHPRARARMSPW